jgi:hypothetical protein
MKVLALDLAKKLDALGLLDNALIAVVQEHSKRGHQAWNVPVITFGSAGGLLKTNQYVDYRNIEWQGCQGGACDDLDITRWGFPMNQVYANILRAMGMQPSDFEPLNKPRSDVVAPFKANSGYGIPGVDPDYAPYTHYDKGAWNGYDMSAWLPRVAA